MALNNIYPDYTPNPDFLPVFLEVAYPSKIETKPFFR
jgi:hypothetical protein